MPLPGHVIVPVRILFGERHVKDAAKVLDIEGRIAVRDFGVGERRPLAEVGVEHVDRAEAGIGGIEMVGDAVKADRQALVHSTWRWCGVVDFGGRHGPYAFPAGDGAILRGEQEPVTTKLGAVAVENRPGGGAGRASGASCSRWDV